MRMELESLLRERFPRLFCQLECRPAESCMAFGVECWEGWFDLIWECSKELEKLHPDIEYAQIKEKFAALTMYVDYPNNSSREEINTILNKYRGLSTKVCEACGTAETVKLRDHKWMKTFCDNCYSKWVSNGWEALDKSLL